MVLHITLLLAAIHLCEHRTPTPSRMVGSVLIIETLYLAFTVQCHTDPTFLISLWRTVDYMAGWNVPTLEHLGQLGLVSIILGVVALLAIREE